MRRVALALLLLACLAPVTNLRAQDRSPRLEVSLDTTRANVNSPLVRTRNLLEETPWLTALRQGLPVQLRYRLEVWRSREGWFDVVSNQYEWQVVIRHEPLLDQFTVHRLFPGQKPRSVTYGTANALGAALEATYRIPVRPTEPSTYYYSAAVDVATLSESDLDNFNKLLRGEIAPGGGGSLAERARRLALQLAGLPKLALSARSDQFEVR